jgi:REP element-mobilizing transposase RayT
MYASLPPGRARIAPGEIIYRALNRANGRTQLFDKPEDYPAFERIMVAAMRRCPIRLLATGLMPNHWHMVLWPKKDGLMTEFLRWLTLTHSQRLHAQRLDARRLMRIPEHGWTDWRHRIGLRKMPSYGTTSIASR